MPNSFFLSAITVANSPEIDIVFVHGLGGSPSDTWAATDGAGEKVFWPRLLGEEITTANVSTLGYPTSKLGSVFGGNELGLITTAAGVVDTLVSHGIGKRPVFFVTHSLGGLVIKAALRQCADSQDPNKTALFASTHAIVFFGTPNTGASMGTVCRHLPGLTSMQSAELARADTLLLDLSNWFRGHAGIDRIRAHAFYETERLNGLVIVDAASANPNVPGCDPVPLVENHVGICRLPSTKHTAFISVRSFIERTCADRGIEIGHDADDTEATLAHTPKLSESYVANLFIATEMRHPIVTFVDERSLFVDPAIYHENSKSRLTTLDRLLTMLVDSEAAIISGNDRAGKSLITKLIQTFFDERGRPTLRIDGRQIATADISSMMIRHARAQYGQDIMMSSIATVIVDDFDECQLPDSVKERIVSELLREFDLVIITSFTTSASVLFAGADRPDPDLFEITPLGDERLLELVEKWKRLGDGNVPGANEKAELATFELLRKIFNQTEVDKFPGSAISFLQLIDSSSGSDITHSSYAACYETLITSHITKIRPSWQNLDEARNFVSYVAFTAYLENHRPTISTESLSRCLEHYRSNYFSSVRDLREVVTDGFLIESDAGYDFREEYEWYFLCARHAATTLRAGVDYDNFVMECSSNIFRKQYANMIVFMAYFTSDNIILSLLLDTLDGLFSKAPSWTLSDEQKTIMLGLTSTDHLSISSSTDTSESRAKILRERVINIIDEAESVVAQYALPFINPDIEDSEYVQAIDPDSIGAESYLRSLNALMRVHSVIGQILASRSGTFDAKTMLDCITRMVMASGRYIALNHAISAVLVFDKSESIDEVDRAYDSKSLSKDEKYQKVERIFSFWSVFVSQAGLARYLSHDHAIRALKVLTGRHESPANYKSGHVPFNFSSVLAIASLYKTNSLDKELFEKILGNYSENSAIIPLLRAAVHFYSYYLPLSIQDKQWLGAKLKMPVRRIELQRRSAVQAGKAVPRLAGPKKARKKVVRQRPTKRR